MPDWLIVMLAFLAPGGVIVAAIERTRRENNRDHYSNSVLLNQIDKKVDKLDSRLDGHIEWHLDKE